MKKTLIAVLFLGTSAAHAQSVVEYVNQSDFTRSPAGQFFYSANPAEQAFVDSGGAGQFKRTGNAFNVGGALPLCRFYGSVSPGPNSHFYTIDAGECNALKSAQITPKPTAQQQWNYEGNGFSATAAVSGKCAAGSVPVYRAYNGAFANGVKNAWDSNHRYSTRRGDIDYLVQDKNWKDEGVAFCAVSAAPDPTFTSAATLERKCPAPRAAAKYGDRLGTIDDQKEWMRSYIDERYLWYDEVPRAHPSIFATPQDYFDVLRTREKTKSAKDKDEFHFAIPTTQWEAFDTGDAGFGYGITPVGPITAKRNYPVIQQVEPGTPAAAAGLTRGMEIISFNGASLLNGANLSTFAASLQTRAAGTRLTLVVNTIATNTQRTVTMDSARITLVPVQNVTIIPTATGNVGYFAFHDFSGQSESQVIRAFEQLKAQNVKDAVIDLRYNGGGYLYISGQMAYMLGGTKTIGKTFQKLLFNRKRVADNNDPDGSVPFYTVSSGIAGSGTAGNVPLPTLNLNRVYVLVSDESASASESFINGLRGVDVEVVLIGTTTRGKPFGFVDEENCGTTYFAVEFQGINAKGFGDFADGFAPTCTVADDDFAHAFGDVNETRLAAALAHRTSGKCPAGTVSIDVEKRVQPVQRFGVEKMPPLTLHRGLAREAQKRAADFAAQ